jgi:hypothetical protein
MGQVLAGSVVLSLLGGIAWSLIAKPTRFLYVGDGIGQAFNGDNVNEFSAIGWFAVLSVIVALLLSIGAWMRLRVHRGIPLLTVIVVASALGSLTMAAVGELIVRFRYPLVENPAIDAVVSFAPRILFFSAESIPVVLILEPLVAAVAILVMTALSPYDDLGTGQSAHHRRHPELAEPAGMEYQR